MKKAFNNNDYSSFLDLKAAFIIKHSKADCTTDTSSMDQYGRYTRTYTFSDGAQLFELNGPVFEEVQVKTEVRGVPVVLTEKVKLFRTETWNSDDASSVYFYEKW